MIFKIVLNFKEKYNYIVDEMTKSDISFKITQGMLREQWIEAYMKPDWP